MIIRSEQFKTFEQAARRGFEDEMMAHGRQFSPRLCEVIGDGQLRQAVHSAISKAEGYGFTYRGPIRLCVELMFLYGSEFDTDPQYEPVGEPLRASGDQMQRAQQMHERYLEYFEKVSGPGAANGKRALSALAAMVRTPLAFSADFAADMRQQMARIYPEKVAYVAEHRLTALIHEGIAEAVRYQFHEPRQKALMVVLKFAFGHGCTRDPLYPWIGQTLRDGRITDRAARASRLERKAITWLDHVIAGDQGGET